METKKSCYNETNKAGPQQKGCVMEPVTFTYVQFMLAGMRECMCFKSWLLANDFIAIMEQNYNDSFKVIAFFDRQV